MIFKLITAIILGLALGACSPSSNQEGVNGPNGPNGGKPGGSEKPVSAPTPFSLEQFVPGQWIIWSRTNNKNETNCVRWRWEKVGTDVNTHTIVGIYSRDCKVWGDDRHRVIKYSPDTGKVEVDRITLDKDDDITVISNPNELKTIYDHLYGRKDKVNFVQASWLVPGQEQSLPTFAVVGKTFVYLNSPGHAFHGVALVWTEKEDETTWKYQVLNADPELPFQK